MKLRGTIGTNLSGSIAGANASRSHGGITSLRGRSAPVNTRSTKQAVVRGAAGSLAAQWSRLTAAERQSWAIFAQQVPQTGSGTGEYVTSASNWFTGANLGRIQSGRPVVTTAPSIYGRAEQIPADSMAILLAEQFGVISAQFRRGQGVAGFVAVYLAAPTARGRASAGNRWNWVAALPFNAIQTTVDADVEDQMVGDVWMSPYGPIAIGDSATLRMVTYYADGRYSSPVEGQVTATPL